MVRRSQPWNISFAHITRVYLSAQLQTSLFRHTHHTTRSSRKSTYTDRKHGAWKVGYVIFFASARASVCILARVVTKIFPDDEEESSGPTSPVVAPVTRRSKFEDEEDDDDVRQPTLPRARIISHPAMHKLPMLTLQPTHRC